MYQIVAGGGGTDGDAGPHATLAGERDRSKPAVCLLGEVEIPDGGWPAIIGRLDSVDTYSPASYRGCIPCLHEIATLAQ